MRVARNRAIDRLRANDVRQRAVESVPEPLPVECHRAPSGGARAAHCLEPAAAAGGRAYQLLVLTAQPAPISAGTLTLDPNGRVNARFDTPPDLPRPVAMAVRLEPEGGCRRRPATSISSASPTSGLSSRKKDQAHDGDERRARKVRKE
ncbi:MAG TPA: anti-sigma factor, partial [Vicinamibacterales bacterium]|nr:anti-sigma factor [Vicinamibacterales bacterium]